MNDVAIKSSVTRITLGLGQQSTQKLIGSLTYRKLGLILKLLPIGPL